MRLVDSVSEEVWKKVTPITGHVTAAAAARPGHIIAGALLLAGWFGGTVGVEPRGYLREATLRAVRNQGTVTLARDVK
jgi:hypothetical protein